MKIKDFSYLEVRGFAAQFLEILIDYDGGSNPVYIGYNVRPNAAQDSPTWYIVKLYYSGSNLTRQQLPVNGVRLVYQWALRTTYFP